MLKLMVSFSYIISERDSASTPGYSHKGKEKKDVIASAVFVISLSCDV